MARLEFALTLARVVLASSAAACLLESPHVAASVSRQWPADVRPGIDLPVVRELRYQVNARVRPFLLFWIGRRDVGDARITWREGADGARALELLIGSDPARAPRAVNRWGYIVERSDDGRVDVLGVMTESDEQTIDDAEAEIGKPGQDTTAYKAARSTIADGWSVGGTMTVHAPSTLTYRDLDTLLTLVPVEPPGITAIELPPATHPGFLAAMERLLRDSIAACLSGGAKAVPGAVYAYKQTVYDLTLTSCDYEPRLTVAERLCHGVMDGRFRLTNRSTAERTSFEVIYGTTGELTGLPVRATFRPRWWMELEMELLDQLEPAGLGALAACPRSAP